jgi:hypothetical protein
MSYFNTINIPTAHLGAFGDLQTMEMTPVFQASFATGIRDQQFGTTSANGGTVDTNASRLRLQTGTASNGSAIIKSERTFAYRAGQGMIIRYTPFFTPGVADSMQYLGVGNDTDGYFWGFNGTEFGIFYRNNSVDIHIPQGSWNEDKCDGTGPSGFNWDGTKGVPTMIKYPYLGFGNIFFYVQKPETGEWVLCHMIQYANTTTSTQITNPFLSFYGQVVNKGNTTNLTAYCGSVGVFMDGPRNYLGPQFGAESFKTSVTTQVNVLALRTATTLNGATNRGLVRLRQLSIASQGGNGLCTIRIRRRATLTGSTFAPISGTTADNGVTLTNAQSSMSVDSTGTFSGGTTIWNGCLNTSSNFQLDLTPYDLYIPAGETVVITAQSTASTAVQVAINWQEDSQ